MKLRAAPELPAFAAVVLVWIFFALIAGPPFRSGAGAAAYLNAAAPLGIIAVPIAMLMIAGQFDLSVGSIIGLCSMAIMLLTTHFGWSVWPAVLASGLLAAAVGLLNGITVVRSRIPSFIVTLATLFIARGLSIALPRWLTGRTQIGGLDQTPGFESARVAFGSALGGVRVTLLWWSLLIIAGSWVLQRSRFGNWVFATGGAPETARAQGVPTARVHIALFVCTALSAWLVAVLQAVRFNGADALRGEQQEFRAIVAAVIGGTLLTGGYGSVVGAAAGALLFGMVQQGIVLSGVDADWFQVILGTLLLAAVFVNRAVQRKLAGS